MLILLFATCLGWANGARGSGISGGKFYMPITMALVAYTIFPNIWYAFIHPIPLLAFWWQPGGTGKWHPIVIKALQWLPVPDNNDSLRWRAFEVGSVFIYSFLYLNLGVLFTH